MVTLTPAGEATSHLASNAEKHMHEGGAASVLTAEDMRDRRFANQRHHYDDAIIAVIRTPETILIFGPEEAKTALKNRLERVGLGDHLSALATTAKLTERQIVAKVRQRFVTAPARVLEHPTKLVSATG